MSIPPHSPPSGLPNIPPEQPGPVDPPVGEGDDDHVILWMLGLSPTQRLEVAQGFVDSVLMLRHGLCT